MTGVNAKFSAIDHAKREEFSGTGEVVRDWAMLEIREDDKREETRTLPVEHGHRRRGRRGGGGGVIERDLPFFFERGDHKRRCWD